MNFMVKFEPYQEDAVKMAMEKRLPFCLYMFPDEDNVVFFADHLSFNKNFDITSADVPERRFIIGDWNCASSSFRFIYDRFDASSTVRFLESMPAFPSQDTPVVNKEISGGDYLHDIATLREELKKNNRHKVVVSRAINHGGIPSDKLWGVVEKVFSSFPHSFRYLYYTPQTGAWMGASPEVMLIYDGKTGTAESMALAGTRPVVDSDKQWGAKDIEEQKIVEDYIKDIMSVTGETCFVVGPETMTTGNLQHLRTTILSVCKPGIDAFTVIDRLNPTPALCGYPKEWALEWIGRLERHERRCYGGVVGVENKGLYKTFVNLRCVNFNADEACIYAGGGIIAQSDPMEEWEETERKAGAILSFLPASNAKTLQ